MAKVGKRVGERVCETCKRRQKMSKMYFPYEITDTKAHIMRCIKHRGKI